MKHCTTKSKLLLIAVPLFSVEAWVALPTTSISTPTATFTMSPLTRRMPRTYLPNNKSWSSLSVSKEDWVDASFEKVQPKEDDDDDDDKNGNATKSETTEDDDSYYDDDDDDDDDEESNYKSLIEMSLDADPKWKNTRVPFFEGNRPIDCKLAFTAELDGVCYGIAVPFDHVAAITIESNFDTEIENISPDDDGNMELMEIMAAQLQEKVSKELSLVKTPRVFTIRGDLDKFTKNWSKELVPAPNSVEELMDEEESSLEHFYEFMRKELGEKEYQDVMNSNRFDIGSELMSLFEMPGVGASGDDVEAFEDMMNSMSENEPKMEGFVRENQTHNGVALKLISCIYPRGSKRYSLVKLLHPYVLVGRLSNESHKGLRFDLLPKYEEAVVIPKLEQMCQHDLEAAGLSNMSP